MTPKQYLQALHECYLSAGIPEVAVGQAAYMRHQFDFYGMKKPIWNAIIRAFTKENGFPAYGGDLEKTVRLAFASPYREMHYSALYILEKSQKKSPSDLIVLLDECIGTHAWWDTVDWLAKLCGVHFLRYPDQRKSWTETWIRGDHMWRQRVAILHQLTYRNQTDQQMLFDYILRVADSREFFLQKAAGWALRQYARTEPKAVRRFVATHTLPALTRREALKHLQG